jgi:hypothetical protein
MFAFLFNGDEIFKTGGISLACQRAAQMIQSALENKYSFHMQVSARAISARGVAM